ncbi:MAG: shikimate dehydrogenase [Thermanaerothrix sp.]|nr:shikimate dehydrogenase [Thermanaerothrix sp.]
MFRIDAQTQVVGIIGWPLQHSLSPIMQNAAFAHVGLNWVYLAFPFPPYYLEEAIHGLRALGVRGFNVTAPYKQAVFPYLDDVSEVARALGAVNTVIVQEDPSNGKRRLYGDNTDVEGFLQAMSTHLGQIPHERAIILGAGGAARAVAYALCKIGFRAVSFVVRHLERGQNLLKDIGRWGFCATFDLVSFQDLERFALMEDVSVLINATPLGTWPEVGVSPLPDSFRLPAHWLVIDLVYNPPKTSLLECAERVGAVGVNGLDMLVHQGALSFHAWCGVDAPIKVMRSACLEAIQHAEVKYAKVSHSR